jgi:hypothetical protein
MLVRWPSLEFYENVTQADYGHLFTVEFFEAKSFRLISEEKWDGGI